MIEEKKLILIAEDDPGIIDMLSMMLEDAGYEVKKTSNSATMLDVLQYHPDLLLLDIWMSGMDGKDICKIIKFEKKMILPVIMMSANKDAQQIAKECGADDFIAKPFEIDAMLKKINEYLLH